MKTLAFKFTTDHATKDCVLSTETVEVKDIFKDAGEASMMEKAVDKMTKVGGRGNKKKTRRARRRRRRPRVVKMIRQVCLRPVSRRWKE